MALVQNYKFVGNIRASAVLTNSFVNATVLGNNSGASIDENQDSPSYNQLIIMIQFTLGSLTSADVRIEFSHDGTTWFQETFQSIVSGTSTDTTGLHNLTAGGNYVLAIPIKFPKIRVAARGNGTVTGSSMTIDAILGLQ